jgi:hypothetical protein
LDITIRGERHIERITVDLQKNTSSLLFLEDLEPDRIGGAVGISRPRSEDQGGIVVFPH